MAWKESSPRPPISQQRRENEKMYNPRLKKDVFKKEVRDNVKRLFRRFDYSSIYLLIGATFIPILLIYIGGTYGIIFAIIQWIIIITGVIFIAIFGPHKLRALHITLYVTLGWSGLLLLPNMIKNNIQLFYYILGGGIIYTLGIIPFALKKKASHFIWHFFVLLGAIVQFIGIYNCIYK